MNTPVPATLTGRKLVVVDVEGNGQSPPEIIEFAGLPVDTTASYADIRTWLIRPQKPITWVVTRKVHGISNDDVAGCPPWSEVAAEIGRVLDGRVLVAHGAHVEHGILGAHLPDWQPPIVLDTVRLAKHVWPGLRSYKLEKLVEHASLDMSAADDQQQHRASFDTWCAWQLLRALVDGGDLDWDGVLKVATLPGSAAPTEPEGGLW